MPTVSDIEDSFFQKACETVVGPAKAELVQLFKLAGFATPAMLRSKHHTFATMGEGDSAALAEVDADMRGAASQPGAPARCPWPPTPSVGSAIIQKVVLTSATLAAAEASAIGMAMVGTTAPAPAATATTAASTAAADKKTAVNLFDLTEKVNACNIDADARVKYEVVARLNKAYVDKVPLHLTLNEFGLQIAAQSADPETHEILGSQWVKVKDGDSKVKVGKINNTIELIEFMENRAQAISTAGTFDVAVVAAAHGRAPPTAEQKLDQSLINFIGDDPSAGVGKVKLCSMDCFATAAVQKTRVDRMRAFLKSYPNVPVSKCIALDTNVEKQYQNLLLRGFTADKGCYNVSAKMPELWSYSALETPSSEAANDSHAGGNNGDAGGGGGGGGGGAQKGKRSQDRTADQQAQAQQRRIEQQEKQIQNLKNGKRGGKGAGGGGRGAPYDQHYAYGPHHGYGGGGLHHSYGQPYQQPPPWAQGWAQQGQGKGGGRPPPIGKLPR